MSLPATTPPSAADETRDDPALPRSGRSAWGEAARLSAILWGMALVFGLVAVARSATVDIPFRDPGGTIFAGKLLKAGELAAVALVLDVVVRAALARRAGRSAGAAVRARWTAPRLALVVSGLVGYHVIYGSYRNLKSWDVFNTPRDTDLLAIDKALFLGHSPAVLLHDLLGRGAAADVLAFVYRSFSMVVIVGVVGGLVLMPRIRQGYLVLLAAAWAWIIGVAGYYLVPSLGPFASAPQEFAGLRATSITSTQAQYLLERAAMLHDGSAPGTFQSISAWPSLHLGLTSTLLFVALAYRWRAVSLALGVFVGATTLATIYFGWHFATDVIAGVLLALAGVTLAKLSLAGGRSLRWDAVTSIDEPAAR